MVHLLPHWSWEGWEGKPIPVWCFSNADSVELFVNGVSKGKRAGENHVFRWEGVTLKEGENAIVARAARAGRRLSDSCTWEYSPGP